MQIVVSVFSIMLPIIFGYFFKLTKIFKAADISAIRKFVVKVTVPFIIFKNLHTADLATLSQLIPLSVSFILLTLLFSITALAVGNKLTKSKAQQNGYLFSVFMGNYGYLGWGVMAYFFGDAGFTRAVFFSMLFWPVFLIFGFGLEYLNGHQERDRKAVFKIMVANGSVPVGVSLLAIVLSQMGYTPIKIIWDFIVKFAAITIPAILFTIGLELKLVVPRSHFKLIVTGALHRVLFGFLLGIITLFVSSQLFNLDEISAKVILMQSIMPTAVLSTFFAAYVKMDNKVQSGIITFSNLLSLGAIPAAFYAVTKLPISF